MARGRTQTVLLHRLDGNGLRRAPDELIVEEPLEIRLDDHLVTTTMRTPGHDLERAAGLVLAGFVRDGRLNLYSPADPPT
jgi:FdhD protein